MKLYENPQNSDQKRRYILLMGKTARVETYNVTNSKSDMHGNISCAKNVSQLFFIYSTEPTLPTRTARG
jgi:hypothetical protein